MSKVGDIILWEGEPYIFADGMVKLKCIGELVSRKEYPELYGRIGMTYADEDKRCCIAELFPLPDLRNWEDRE